MKENKSKKLNMFTLAILVLASLSSVAFITKSYSLYQTNTKGEANTQIASPFVAIHISQEESSEEIKLSPMNHEAGIEKVFYVTNFDPNHQNEVDLSYQLTFSNTNANDGLKLPLTYTLTQITDEERNIPLDQNHSTSESFDLPKQKQFSHHFKLMVIWDISETENKSIKYADVENIVTISLTFMQKD